MTATSQFCDNTTGMEEADLTPTPRKEGAADLAYLVEQLYLQDPLQHALSLKAAEDDFSITGDDLATLTVLRQMDEELAFKTRELDNIVAEHEDVLAAVEQEWRDEVEEARAEAKELRDVLAERESECKDLRLTISNLKANADELHSKFEAALAHLKEKSEAKDAETEDMCKTTDKLSEYFNKLRMKDASDRLHDDEASKRECHEALSPFTSPIHSSREEHPAQRRYNAVEPLLTHTSTYIHLSSPSY
ncbi:hypothetical protein B0H14DRAFT_3585928 [Mycena olivaceomarginata]|nr:hypothetical protein B0H14DRAFT_3585928 [Mycena olivaceomarginata]